MWPVVHIVERRDAYRVLVGKPEGKKTDWENQP
jgi:hypothetical protein